MASRTTGRRGVTFGEATRLRYRGFLDEQFPAFAQVVRDASGVSLEQIDT